MSGRALHRHARSMIASGLALVVVAGGIAWAAGVIPGSDGVIHGCYINKTGNLRVIDPATTSCNEKETAISWNQTGPPGVDGTNGDDGQDGDSLVGSTCSLPDGTDGTVAMDVAANGAISFTCAIGGGGGGGVGDGDDVPVGTGAAILANDGANDVTFIASGQCADLVKTGWTLVGCEQVTMPGGEVMWVVEKKTAADGVAWGTRIYLPGAGAGEWSTELQVLDETGGIYAEMGVATTQLTSSAPDIAVCVRIEGTGSFLSYDVVRYPQGGPIAVVAHRGEFEAGSIVFGSSPARIEDYDFDGTSAFTKSTIQWGQGQFFITDTETSLPSAPASEIC